ncbi:MFS transporter [Piscinibacterium candidicorallinum]|uniref:MFS transporter n=1 Tax=Piscinibacterium candidicorallinum TaxID=1793872 RepID=A0ABV7H4M3_9BURK
MQNDIARTVLNEGVQRREVFGWAAYDFANSGYTTVVLTAVFNAYFVGVVAQGHDWGTLAWTLTLGVSSLLIMFTAPGIGAYADRYGRKKLLLGAATVACVLGTAGLALVGRGDLWLAVALIILTNYAFSLGETLNGAFLPELARPNHVGTVSGWGWSFGYFGGMLTLGLSLAWVMQQQAAGATAEQFVPGTMLITAVVFAVASVLTFVLLRERAGGQGVRVHQPDESGLQQLWRSYQKLAHTPQFARLLACGVLYQAGISVVITLAAVYAAEVMGFTQTQTMMLVFLVNIAAALGAFGFGYLQDRVGHRRALTITLVAWMLMVVLAFFARSATLFWVAAVFAGLAMGSSQSCGRAMVALLAPPSMLAEFFGLWAFATRLAAVVGPVTYGVITWVTEGNHRIAMLVTGLFFVLAWGVLRKLDMAAGQRQAEALEAEKS